VLLTRRRVDANRDASLGQGPRQIIGNGSDEDESARFA
jgi:hypothetical protein